MRKFILLLTIIIAAISAILFYKNYSKPIPALKFSNESCYSTKIDPFVPPQNGILSKAWKDGSILLVEGFVKANCGASITGGYMLNGNDLNLTYQEVVEEGHLADCICSRVVYYEISNLPKKDYTISINMTD